MRLQILRVQAARLCRGLSVGCRLAVGLSLLALSSSTPAARAQDLFITSDKTVSTPYDRIFVGKDAMGNLYNTLAWLGSSVNQVFIHSASSRGSKVEATRYSVAGSVTLERGIYTTYDGSITMNLLNKGGIVNLLGGRVDTLNVVRTARSDSSHCYLDREWNGYAYTTPNVGTLNFGVDTVVGIDYGNISIINIINNDTRVNALDNFRLTINGGFVGTINHVGEQVLRISNIASGDGSASGQKIPPAPVIGDIFMNGKGVIDMTNGHVQNLYIDQNLPLFEETGDFKDMGTRGYSDLLDTSRLLSYPFYNKISNGTIDNLFLMNKSDIIVNGNAVIGYIELRDNSRVYTDVGSGIRYINSGKLYGDAVLDASWENNIGEIGLIGVKDIHLYDNSVASSHQGEFHLHDNATVKFSGSSPLMHVYYYDSGKIMNVERDPLKKNLLSNFYIANEKNNIFDYDVAVKNMYNTSKIPISVVKGTADLFTGINGSYTDINGGSFKGIAARGGSTVVLHGTAPDNIQSYDTSVIRLDNVTTDRVLHYENGTLELTNNTTIGYRLGMNFDAKAIMDGASANEIFMEANSVLTFKNSTATNVFSFYNSVLNVDGTGQMSQGSGVYMDHNTRLNLHNGTFSDIILFANSTANITGDGAVPGSNIKMTENSNLNFYSGRINSLAIQGTKAANLHSGVIGSLNNANGGVYSLDGARGGVQVQNVTGNNGTLTLNNQALGTVVNSETVTVNNSTVGSLTNNKTATITNTTVGPVTVNTGATTTIRNSTIGDATIGGNTTTVMDGVTGKTVRTLGGAATLTSSTFDRYEIVGRVFADNLEASYLRGYVRTLTNSVIDTVDIMVNLAAPVTLSGSDNNTIRALRFSDQGTLTLAGMNLDTVDMQGNTLKVTGGTIGSLSGRSFLNLSGGNIGNIVGGSLTRAVRSTISGGSIGGLTLNRASYYDISGGTFYTSIFRIFDSSIMNLIGTDFKVSYAGDGSDVAGNYGVYLLSGMLSNGFRLDGISIYDYYGHASSYQIGNTSGSTSLYFNGVAATLSPGATAPEPGTLALLALGLTSGVLLFVRRR